MKGEDNDGFEFSNTQAVTNNNTSQEAKTPELSDSEKRKAKFLIYKNVLLISASFLLLFVAFESMSKLQSSINKVQNLGTWANAMVYASLIFSCMFLPSILIKKLGVKWSLVVCVFCYSSYIAAQFYPEFYTLIPTAFVLGLGAAPMWSAKCTYLTQTANRLAEINEEEPEPYVVKFFGIFFFFFQCNSIIGNIISTAVLSNDRNKTVSVSEEDMKSCGAAYCPASLSSAPPTVNITELEPEPGNTNFDTSLSSIYTLAGIYLACSVTAALIIAIFVDPLTRHMRKPKQLLMIPLTFWSGIEQGFFGADFTAGFVTCAYGVHIIGRVLICYGVFDAISSVGFGFIIKLTGRVPIFILGALINISIIIVMFTWTPTPGSQPVVYVIAAFWGIADAIWQTQINALYGNIFASDEEAAFSNYRLWESLGFLVAFVTQACGVCVAHKLILAIHCI
ncbi:UNC93-like protein isoform X2 [Eurytemora carolleeae]|uniref:UNC93-like protein isoform X2 n=1 Tax=Eurytemora carolleeae TaxID=1294199 RepID=UPI000C76E314|nr:UNC93-like protein isoform X2 [Eurytemora carolleeae]|eukprot:XP_023320214.1 UNC93-like protein isoform X2 [Eurytemora affinis]